MRNGASIAVIIPAFNEEPSVGKVISAIPEWVDDIIVADNGSTDKTAEVARGAGARVVSEPRRGYGSACLAAMGALRNPDIVVFLDGDFSDFPEEMPLLVDPIASGESDMVIGSRTIGRRESGALTPQALFGNWLSCTLIRCLWGVSYTDLGPFRAIRYSSLQRLRMRDPNYGWTVEMQIKAAREAVRTREVPVSYRRRIGKSKVSGTVKGVIGAGTKILGTIFLAAAGLLPGDRAAAARERLIIFTRYPIPNETKTRLIPALGANEAAGLQQLMTEHAVARARQLKGRRSVSIEIRYEGGDKRLIRRWLGSCLTCRRQHEGDIGARMERAFHAAFEEKAERVVLVGTDCPGITADLLDRAFDALDRNDLVLGPASDGGYYLIGLRRTAPQLFTGIPWGTEDVFRLTVQAADEAELSTGVVDTLDDVDRPEDVPVWERECRTSPLHPSNIRISVIIPALDEETVVGSAVASARRVPGVEVIVADGGSSDQTTELAQDAGAKVISSASGRARQMNAGAAAATGNVLVFLHADTRLPDGFRECVRETLARPDTAAGSFELRIDATHRGLRLIERVITWRSRYLHMPYGDQALFLQADLFSEMGGFPEVPIMEDFEFVRRLHRHGRIEIAPAGVVTSARRWLARGIWRTTLANQMIVLSYFLGVPLTRIARWYRRPR